MYSSPSQSVRNSCITRILSQQHTCHDPVGVTNPDGILESWVQLHCRHRFGTHCIQQWLQVSARHPWPIPTCPICRRLIVPAPITSSAPMPYRQKRFSEEQTWLISGSCIALRCAARYRR
ncbi:hypothetical protein F5Y17DRAFT_451900 [Xylariaceae sp. FL0594]|nr:hypothetical protein F5Y17DRAFT_451900 [Xylariaceae sp. FL0594]